VRRDGGVASMSVLYLVRHGQASFLADDYDQLSSLGEQQSQLLGQFWIENSIEIDEVYTGSLLRQRQTADATGERFRAAGLQWPAPQLHDGLNEYCADQFMEVLRVELAKKHPHIRSLSESLNRATSERDQYTAFHRLLAELMKFYIAGEYDSTGFETWRQFHDRVNSALEHIRSQPGRGRRIAVFTSGGPVGVATQTMLQAPEQQAGELNWRIYNASMTTFQFSADRISLDQFNAIPHLTREDLRTYR